MQMTQQELDSAILSTAACGIKYDELMEVFEHRWSVVKRLDALRTGVNGYRAVLSMWWRGACFATMLEPR